MTDGNVFARPQGAILETNKLIRNTYTLLAMTLLFSSAMSAVAITMDLPYFGFLINIVGIIGLYALVYFTRNSVMGIVSVFAFTGFMGLSIGPILNAYMTNFSNGSEIVMLAMGITGTLFLGLSGYVLTTRKDFSFMAGFLTAGMILVIVCSLVAMFFDVPGFQLAISAAVAMLMCGFILWETSDLVNGNETNYVMATVGLYISILNLFMSILRLLGAFMGED
jgi:modulator of FtsH protease